MLTPKFISLDTSQIGDWIRDYYSDEAKEREEARKFQTWLADNQYVLFLTFDHIEELLQHDNQSVARGRLTFLWGQQILAWVGSEHEGAISGVTTILASELRTALSDPSAAQFDITQKAFRRFLRVGTGAEMLGPTPEVWMLLRPYFADRAQQAMQVTGIADSSVVDMADVPIRRLVQGGLRSGRRLTRQLDVMQGSIASDLVAHGDHRIPDASGTAANFMAEVEIMGQSLPQNNAREFVLDALRRMHILEEDIWHNATVGEILEWGEFLKQAHIVAPEIPIASVKKIPFDRIPSALISRQIRKHQPISLRRSGSNLNDRHLACLSAYADVLFVDKRTHEAFRRARQSSYAMQNFCRRIEKTTNYKLIPTILK